MQSPRRDKLGRVVLVHQTSIGVVQFAGEATFHTTLPAPAGCQTQSIAGCTVTTCPPGSPPVSPDPVNAGALSVRIGTTGGVIGDTARSAESA